MDVATHEDNAICYEDRLSLIEQQELESPQGRLLPETYSEFLALYLLQGDLCNCKLLWKRIPGDIKTDCSELVSIWEVCKAFFKKDFAGVIQLCNGYDWGEVTRKIFEDVKLRHRDKCISLICKTYSELTTEHAASLLGCSSQECLKIANQRDWKVSEDSSTIAPSKNANSAIASISNEPHLRKLTGYISFLET